MTVWPHSNPRTGIITAAIVMSDDYEEIAHFPTSLNPDGKAWLRACVLADARAGRPVDTYIAAELTR